MSRSIKTKTSESAMDNINHPPHYNTGGVECIEYIKQVLGTEGYIAYCRGNAMKYQHRAAYKGKFVEDLAKGEWYMREAAKAAAELANES